MTVEWKKTRKHSSEEDLFCWRGGADGRVRKLQEEVIFE